jgi:hypothetical protein
MNEGIALVFHCRTTSPLHTTRQQYSNLIKCAPFILGSTLRGAILARLIEREVCPHLDKAVASSDSARIGELHRACENPACPIKPFFPDGAPLAWFSFGLFDAPDPARPYRAATRIALERETGSVAEGAIITIESIAPDTPFTFSVTLFGEAMRVSDDVEWAVEATARTQGIGRFRSIGYGQFRVEKSERVAFAERVERERTNWREAEKVSAEFATPYVIGTGDGKVEGLNRQAFAQTIQAQASDTLRAIGVDSPVQFSDAALTLTPDYVSRFSYEQGGPQHRLVAWQGSRLVLTLAHADEEARRALAAIALLGLGEWRECGFGQIAPEGS